MLPWQQHTLLAKIEKEKRKMEPGFLWTEWMSRLQMNWEERQMNTWMRNKGSTGVMQSIWCWQKRTLFLQWRNEVQKSIQFNSGEQLPANTWKQLHVKDSVIAWGRWGQRKIHTYIIELFQLKVVCMIFAATRCLTTPPSSRSKSNSSSATPPTSLNAQWQAQLN